MYWVLHIPTCQLGWNLTHYTVSVLRDGARSEMFTSQDRWCMKSGRRGTELFLRFFTVSHHCAHFSLVLQATCDPSWPMMGSCIFHKAPPDLSPQAIPYRGGASISLKLLCPPVNLPLLWCLHKFYQLDINDHLSALLGGREAEHQLLEENKTIKTTAFHNETNLVGVTT